MDDWPDLWALLHELPSEPDQRMLTAFKMCPTDRSVHDIHVLRALFRLNPTFVRHPYAGVLFEELKSQYDPGEFSHQLTGRSLAGAVVPSLNETLLLASRTRVLSTNSFLAAWAEQCLDNGGSKYKRSYLIKDLMGDADTSEGGIYDVPELEHFLLALSVSPPFADDVEYIVTLEGQRIVFRPVSVLDDYVQRADSGLLVPQRALLTHHNRQFGSFTQDQVNELDEIINNDSAKETDYQKFFDRYPHFLRRWDHREIHSQVYLSREDSGPLVPDFILTDTELQKAVVVDLKLPTARIVRRQRNRDRFSAAIIEARAQLLEYRDWFEDSRNRAKLKESLGMQIYRPRLAVIIGRSSEFTDELDRQKLSSRETDIEIVTYDDIARYATRRLVMIEE